MEVDTACRQWKIWSHEANGGVEHGLGPITSVSAGPATTWPGPLGHTLELQVQLGA